MTQCTQSGFDFKAHFSRDIVARFDGGTISSDGGSLLLRQTDQRLNLLTRFANCFLDGRRQDRVEHSLVEMISQRVYGLALGYEDLNDHEQLRKDPLFGILAGREELDRPLAGKSTLNRLELGNGQEDRYKKITFWKQGIDEVLVRDVLRTDSGRLIRWPSMSKERPALFKGQGTTFRTRNHHPVCSPFSSVCPQLSEPGRTHG
jgi:hypothetical protein